MRIPPHPDPDFAPRPLVALATDYPSGSATPRHNHRRAQLIFVTTGSLRLETEEGVWVAPLGRAVWIPGETNHKARYAMRSSVRVAFIDQTVFPGGPSSCAVLVLTGLLQELVLRAIDLGWHWPTGGRAERAMRVLVDELTGLEAQRLFLPYPRDPRLHHIVEAMSADPANDGSLEDWARFGAISPRTLARLFQKDTGLSFGRWREQLRLTRAIERLAGGDSIIRVAHDMGYSSASAFTTMFTRALGQPPRAYMAEVTGQSFGDSKGGG